MILERIDEINIAFWIDVLSSPSLLEIFEVLRVVDRFGGKVYQFLRGR